MLKSKSTLTIFICSWALTCLGCKWSSSINWWMWEKKTEREMKNQGLLLNLLDTSWHTACFIELRWKVSISPWNSHLPVGWNSCPFFNHFTSTSGLATSTASLILCPFVTWYAGSNFLRNAAFLIEFKYTTFSYI